MSKKHYISSQMALVSAVQPKECIRELESAAIVCGDRVRRQNPPHTQRDNTTFSFIPKSHSHLQ